MRAPRPSDVRILPPHDQQFCRCVFRSEPVQLIPDKERNEENMSDTSSFPQLTQARRVGLFLLQIVLGAIAGGLLALIGGWVGPLITDEASNGWSDLVGSVLGALAGFALGMPLGVIAAGALLRRRGRALLCLVGGVVGGVAVLALAEPLQLNRQSGVLVAAYALMVLAGALVGFHMRRKPGA
jgi:hypothetical protein